MAGDRSSSVTKSTIFPSVWFIIVVLWITIISTVALVSSAFFLSLHHHQFLRLQYSNSRDYAICRSSLLLATPDNYRLPLASSSSSTVSKKVSRMTAVQAAELIESCRNNQNNSTRYDDHNSSLLLITCDASEGKRGMIGLASILRQIIVHTNNNNKTNHSLISDTATRTVPVTNNTSPAINPPSANHAANNTTTIKNRNTNNNTHNNNDTQNNNDRATICNLTLQEQEEEEEEAIKRRRMTATDDDDIITIETRRIHSSGGKKFANRAEIAAVALGIKCALNSIPMEERQTILIVTDSFSAINFFAGDDDTDDDSTTSSSATEKDGTKQDYAFIKDKDLEKETPMPGQEHDERIITIKEDSGKRKRRKRRRRKQKLSRLRNSYKCEQTIISQPKSKSQQQHPEQQLNSYRRLMETIVQQTYLSSSFPSCGSNGQNATCGNNDDGNIITNENNHNGGVFMVKVKSTHTEEDGFFDHAAADLLSSVVRNYANNNDDHHNNSSALQKKIIKKQPRISVPSLTQKDLDWLRLHCSSMEEDEAVLQYKFNRSELLENKTMMEIRSYNQKRIQKCKKRIQKEFGIDLLCE